MKIIYAILEMIKKFIGFCLVVFVFICLAKSVVIFDYFYWRKGLVATGLDIVNEEGDSLLAIKNHIETKYRYNKADIDHKYQYNKSYAIFFVKPSYQFSHDDVSGYNAINDEYVKSFFRNDDNFDVISGYEDSTSKFTRFGFCYRHQGKYRVSLRYYEMGIPNDITIIANEDSIENYDDGYLKIKDKWLIQFWLD